MTNKGGLQRYIYWSDRRIRALLEDQDIRTTNNKQSKWSTPHFRGTLPAFEHTREEQGTLSRPELASLIEKTLDERAVSDFDAPGPIHFARGIGDVVIGEFAHTDDPRHAIFFFEQQLSWNFKVSVCLFGSMENMSQFVTDGGPSHVRGGWTSSSAPAVLRYIRSWDPVGNELHTPKQLALEVVKIAESQGEWTSERPHGWQRAYTYGDVIGVGEWLAEIYLDQELKNEIDSANIFTRRVLVGAPLWVRTPKVQALRVYADYSEEDLDATLPGRSRDVPSWYWPS